MKKPWTVRLVSIGTGVTVAYAGDMPRFWTHRGAMKRCRLANRQLKRSTHFAVWLPTLTKRSAWS